MSYVNTVLDIITYQQNILENKGHALIAIVAAIFIIIVFIAIFI